MLSFVPNDIVLPLCPRIQSGKAHIVTFLRFVLTIITPKIKIYSCNIVVPTRALLKVVMDKQPPSSSLLLNMHHKWKKVAFGNIWDTNHVREEVGGMFVEADDSLPQLVSSKAIREGPQLPLHLWPWIHISKQFPEWQPGWHKNGLKNLWRYHCSTPRITDLSKVQNADWPHGFHVGHHPRMLGELLHGLLVSSSHIVCHAHGVL